MLRTRTLRTYSSEATPIQEGIPEVVCFVGAYFVEDVCFVGVYFDEDLFFKSARIIEDL